MGVEKVYDAALRVKGKAKEVNALAKRSGSNRKVGDPGNEVWLTVDKAQSCYKSFGYRCFLIVIDVHGVGFGFSINSWLQSNVFSRLSRWKKITSDPMFPLIIKQSQVNMPQVGV